MHVFIVFGKHIMRVVHIVPVTFQVLSILCICETTYSTHTARCPPMFVEAALFTTIFIFMFLKCSAL